MSCHDPDDPANWPRNMFVWRSNLLGSSGKGHEYFLKHLLGTSNGVLGKDLGVEGREKPQDVAWHDKAPEGKLDLLVTLDFRMSTTCVYSDIVLPTATWYEKNDLNTSDMHPFIHPLTAAVDPAWESRTDWDIYKGIAAAFSKICPEVLGRETDVVLTPMLHDTPGELAQPYGVSDWKRDGTEPVPGRTMPSVAVVERDYPNLYARFTAIGPLLEKLGNGGKGIAWDTAHEIEFLAALNGTVRSGAAAGQPRLETDVDAIEAILSLAPETNGEVAVKAWEALGKMTGRDHTHLARAEGGREDPLPRHRRAAAQDHLLANLVRHRKRQGLLQRRLHQRPRTHPLADADRAPAALPGSSLDARVRRGAGDLAAAGGHQGHGARSRASTATATPRSC